VRATLPLYQMDGTLIYTHWPNRISRYNRHPEYMKLQGLLCKSIILCRSQMPLQNQSLIPLLASLHIGPMSREQHACFTAFKISTSCTKVFWFAQRRRVTPRQIRVHYQFNAVAKQCIRGWWNILPWRRWECTPWVWRISLASGSSSSFRNTHQWWLKVSDGHLCRRKKINALSMIKNLLYNLLYLYWVLSIPVAAYKWYYVGLFGTNLQRHSLLHGSIDEEYIRSTF